MLNFWLIAILMILLALFIVLRTLLFPGNRNNTNKESVNVAIFKSRNEELENEIENGILNNGLLPEVRDDLKRSLLNDLNTQAASQHVVPDKMNRDWWTAGIVTILLPAITISVYLVLGASELNNKIQDHPAIEDIESLETIETMVEGLATRLKNEPDDLQGWFMLAKSYMVLGKYNEAVSAFEHLYKLDATLPDVLLGYANALALANQGKTTGKPEQLAKKVLAMDPDNRNGLWIVGMAAFERGELQHAIDYWQQLLVQLEQGTDTYKDIEELISRTEQQLITSSDQTATEIPDQLSIDETNTISVNVSLSDHLLPDTKPSDTIFIFARAVEGPPMPIAVVSKQVRDLPLSVVLDDSVAMMDQRKLSDFDKVIVSARISLTGNAMPQPGDLTGNNITVDMMQTDTVDILIDQKLP